MPSSVSVDPTRADSLQADAPGTPRSLAAVPAGDAALAARIRSGDTAAFDTVFTLYAKPLAAFAWRFVESRDTAVDVVQDVFVTLWQHRTELALRASLRAYLYSAVRNRSLNVLKRAAVEDRWRHAARADTTALRAAPKPASDPVERAELVAAMHGAIGKLPRKAREVARLWFLDQLTHAEIAQVMGMSANAVAVHITRLTKRLRELLSGVWP